MNDAGDRFFGIEGTIYGLSHQVDKTTTQSRLKACNKYGLVMIIINNEVRVFDVSKFCSFDRQTKKQTLPSCVVVIPSVSSSPIRCLELSSDESHFSISTDNEVSVYCFADFLVPLASYPGRFSVVKWNKILPHTCFNTRRWQR